MRTTHNGATTLEMKMKPIFAISAVMAVVVGLVSADSIASANPGQSSGGAKDLAVWVGDWTMVGFLKDSPSDKEHPVTWRLHGRWVLGGRAVQTDQEWIRDGVTTKNFEVLSYNQASKSLVSYGVGEDGSGWTTTLVINGDIATETGEVRLPDGSTVSVKWTWTFSPDRLSLSAVCESEQKGAKWVSAKIKGTKAR